tara:strand:- start:10415 stop:10702 length:288 start_codon:yes stop_codon:yes gene_type:complete
MYALIVFCIIVTLLSGVSLFWSVTSHQGELWLHGIFLIALTTALLAMLSLIRKFAGHSISSSINIHHLEDQVQVEDPEQGHEDNEQSGDEERKAG